MAMKTIQLSLGELCKLVIQEFADALDVVRRTHPKVAVRSVKLKIGQVDETQKPTEENASSPELLLTQRYKGIGKGWLMELDLGERLAATLKGEPQDLPGVYIPTALDLFTEHPLKVIKGINSEWSQFFADFEITRVRHLARMDDQRLQQLIATSHSMRPREFHRKAMLLDIAVPPLPKSNLHDQSLYQLLALSVDQAHQAFGIEQVALSEVVSLYELLEVLTIVIDSRLLRQTSLAQLLAC